MVSHCDKSIHIRSFSGLYFPAFLDFPVYIFPYNIFPHFCISPYSVRMRENTDQKNSEKGHFLRIVTLGAKETKTTINFTNKFID